MTAINRNSEEGAHSMKRILSLADTTRRRWLYPLSWLIKVIQADLDDMEGAPPPRTRLNHNATVGTLATYLPLQILCT